MGGVGFWIFLIAIFFSKEITGLINAATEWFKRIDT